ncbi:MAG: VWA domain-containing protein [Acidobacteriota bacterium]
MFRALLFRAVFVFVLANSMVVPVTAEAPATDAAPTSLLVVLDASGSMWGRLGDDPKVVVARQVLADLATDLHDDSRVGVVAYGHNREGDCGDVETVLPLGPLDRDQLRATIGGLNPKGKTPITTALAEAFTVVEAAGEPVTVVLISDGLETCGGDPCLAVRTARAKGIPLLLHVVGFDVADEDVSSLECAAQAGGGLYFDARDADGLGQALDRAVELPAETPTARLVVGARVDDEYADVVIRVADAEGTEVAIGRTYTSAETNPRAIPLPAGSYRAQLKPVGLKAATEELFEFEIADGETVEKHLDYSSGELVLRVRKNDQPMDAVARVVRADTEQQVAIKRTYDRDEVVLTIAAGTYDVTVKPTKIKGADTTRIEGIEISPKGRVEHEVTVATGILHLDAKLGGEPADATVNVYRESASGSIAQGRLYASDTKVKTFEVLAGDYRVVFKAKTPNGSQKQTLETTVEPNGEVTVTATFDG